MKKILLVDMDQVVCHFDKAILAVNPNIVTLTSHAPNYPERSRMVEKVMLDNPHIFRTLEPIEGSIDAVNRLWDHFNVYFLSTPCWMIPESYTDKRLWIGEHFGDKAENRLILSQRKDLCLGDYLVDDRLVNGAEQFTGKHIHFGTEEFPTWVEVESYLMKVKDEKELYSTFGYKQ